MVCIHLSAVCLQYVSCLFTLFCHMINKPNKLLSLSSWFGPEFRILDSFSKFCIWTTFINSSRSTVKKMFCLLYESGAEKPEKPPHICNSCYIKAQWRHQTAIFSNFKNLFNVRYSFVLRRYRLQLAAEMLMRLRDIICAKLRQICGKL